MDRVDVLIIGGGASGFFCGCELLIQNPKLKVAIWEKSNKTLSKVRISGGGRCNVTHAVPEPRNLLKFYPRGSKYLKHKFQLFNVKDTINWFQEKGVTLKVEADNRMFPQSNSSETIAALLEETFRIKGGELKKSTTIASMEKYQDSWKIADSNQNECWTTYIVFAIGGLNPSKVDWLTTLLPLSIKSLVPSIFTLNLEKSGIEELPGISVPNGRVKYEGFKAIYEGPVLITHWGLSGPAVLASSAWHAIDLHEKNYRIAVYVTWVAVQNEEECRTVLTELLHSNTKKNIQNVVFPGIPKRLWLWLLDRAQIPSETMVGNLKKESINRLVEQLFRSRFMVKGKTTYKEEFVTAGGIDLAQLNNDGSLKSDKSIYLLGEMLDLDGVTGGFNFQAAWSTAFVAATSINSNN